MVDRIFLPLFFIRCKLLGIYVETKFNLLTQGNHLAVTIKFFCSIQFTHIKSYVAESFIVDETINIYSDASRLVNQQFEQKKHIPNDDSADKNVLNETKQKNEWPEYSHLAN